MNGEALNDVVGVKCSLTRCTDLTGWKGWAYKTDPFTGEKSGMLRQVVVCTYHRYILRGKD